MLITYKDRRTTVDSKPFKYLAVSWTWAYPSSTLSTWGGLITSSWIKIILILNPYSTTCSPSTTSICSRPHNLPKTLFLVMGPGLRPATSSRHSGVSFLGRRHTTVTVMPLMLGLGWGEDEEGVGLLERFVDDLSGVQVDVWMLIWDCVKH